jgi:hypothetical protein
MSGAFVLARRAAAVRRRQLCRSSDVIEYRTRQRPRPRRGQAAQAAGFAVGFIGPPLDLPIHNVVEPAIGFSVSPLRRKNAPVRTRTAKETLHEISCSPGLRPAREKNGADEPHRPTWTACANAMT